MDSKEQEVKQKIIYCDICGEKLVTGSINYYEGYHIDGCNIIDFNEDDLPY